MNFDCRFLIVCKKTTAVVEKPEAMKLIKAAEIESDRRARFELQIEP
jgi:hypothetical protein